MTPIQAKGEVAQTLHIADSETAFPKGQRYSQRCEPSWPRSLANVPVDDDPQSDADQERDEGDADAVANDVDEDVLYAGPPGNFRRRRRRSRRSRNGYRFGRRGFGQRQAYAYPQ